MSAAMLHRPKVPGGGRNPWSGWTPGERGWSRAFFRQLRRNGVSILMSHPYPDRGGRGLRPDRHHPQTAKLLTEGPSGNSSWIRAGRSEHLEDAFLKLTGGQEEQAPGRFPAGRPPPNHENLSPAAVLPDSCPCSTGFGGARRGPWEKIFLMALVAIVFLGRDFFRLLQGVGLLQGSRGIRADPGQKN